MLAALAKLAPDAPAEFLDAVLAARHPQRQDVHHHRRHPRRNAAQPRHVGHAKHDFLGRAHTAHILGGQCSEHIRPRLQPRCRNLQQTLAEGRVHRLHPTHGIVTGSGRSGQAGGGRRALQCLQPPLPVRVAARITAVAGIVGQHTRQRRQRATGAARIQRADTVSEQRHAIAIGGQVMHAQIPGPALAAQVEQHLLAQSVAGRINYAGAIGLHRGACRLLRIGRSSNIAQLQ
ncbi:hypothetical protein D3C72_1266720 [compost metagenome]